MKRNSILHIKSAPYHLVTNGWTGRLVRHFRNTFRKMEGSGSLKEKLNVFLFMYRITAQSATVMLPAEPIMNRILNLKLSIIKPDAE